MLCCLLTDIVWYFISVTGMIMYFPLVVTCIFVLFVWYVSGLWPFIANKLIDWLSLHVFNPCAMGFNLSLKRIRTAFPTDTMTRHDTECIHAACAQKLIGSHPNLLRAWNDFTRGRTDQFSRIFPHMTANFDLRPGSTYLTYRCIGSTISSMSNI